MKIFNWLTKIPSDKLLHFGISAGIYIVIFKILVTLFSLYNAVPYVLAGVLTLAIGYTKEIIDEKRGSKVDFKDLLADALGILCGVLIMIL